VLPLTRSVALQRVCVPLTNLCVEEHQICVYSTVAIAIVADTLDVSSLLHYLSPPAYFYLLAFTCTLPFSMSTGQLN